MLELLDEVAAHPERWKDVRMKQLGDRRWRREVPHIFRRYWPRTRLPIDRRFTREVEGKPWSPETVANGRRRTAVSLKSKAMGRRTR